MRLAVSVICLCIAMIPQQAKGVSDRLSPQEIVNRVNKDPKSTWKADSYGMDEIDAQKFARSRLGLRFDFGKEDVGRGTEDRERPVMNWQSDFQGMKK